MKTLMKSVLAAAVLAFAAPANATGFTCTATDISFVGTSSGGGVMVHAGFGEFYLCNLDTPWGGVSVDTCRAWLSEVLTAQGMNRPVHFYFDTAHPMNASMTGPDYCASTNYQWEVRSPYFIRFDL